MRRTVISLCVITFFIVAVVLADQWFMWRYVDGFNLRLDALEAAKDYEQKKICASDLDGFFEDGDFIAHRLIPTGRLEEIEMLLHKLNAYIEKEDFHEIEATIAEIRARVNLLYSTDFYHWYHPFSFRIE